MNIATELKKEADKNKVFNDVCAVFALRERARSQVTVNALKAAMEKNGFTYAKDDYKDVIARLARLGVGKLNKDSKGRVRGLTDVKYTLQSIGLTAVGEKLNLAPFNARNKFTKLPDIQESPTEIREAAVKTKQPDTALVSKVNGKTIHIPLTQDQFTAFLSELLEARISK